MAVVALIGLPAVAIYTAFIYRIVNASTRLEETNY
jgi:cytochrome bd-type quinol oxidase subunit 2